MTSDHKCRFYEVWTKKESRIKWEGNGLHKALSTFSIFESGDQGCAYHNVFQNNEAICYVCSTKKETPTIRMINTDSFIQSVIQLLNQGENKLRK